MDSRRTANHSTGTGLSIDEAIVESYSRTPPDDDFGAAWSVRASIEAEPWEPGRSFGPPRHTG